MLRSHVLSCLSSNYLFLDDSDEGSDIVIDHNSIEIATSSENGQHGDNLQLQSENYETNSNKSPAVEEEQRNSVRHINIYMMKSIILFNIVRNKILTILLRSLNVSKKN